MIRNKRGVSVIVGYIMLIAIAVIMSVIVYSWLKSYTPRDAPDCPGGVSLLLSDISCDLGDAEIELNFSLKNNGRFNVDGYLIHATDSPEQELATISLSEYFDDSLGGVKMGEAIRFWDDKSLVPGNEFENNFKVDKPKVEDISKLEIKPFRFEEIDGKQRFVVCGKSRIFEEVVCG